MDKIRNIRLANHHLSAARLQTPKDLVAWMGAMQAQDYNMAKWAVGIRLPGCKEKKVETAFNKGEILRTHVLRPTWHFVAPSAIRWMLALSAERIKSSSKSRDRDLEITEELYSKTNQLIQKALEGHKCLTREDIGIELERAGIMVNSSRLVHFMMRAEVEAIVCSGTLQGKSHTYTLLDERVPPAKPLHKEEALAKLAYIYFSSHCPATLTDFVWWSGLSQAEARKGLEAVKANFIADEIGGQTYWFGNDFKEVPNVAGSAYLLPAFDEYIISYRYRQAAISSAHHGKAISSNGVFRPTIVANGQVIGLWKKSTAKNNSPLLNFFEPQDVYSEKKVNKAIEAFNVYSEVST